MRYWVNCKTCAELIFFDIEGASPAESCSLSEIVEEKLGPLDPDLLYGVAKEILERRGLKETRLFKNCPKCGVLTMFSNWAPLN